MGFGQGLSGLNAAAQNLDVIGNNIANSGTVGFKSSTASFADVYASSRRPGREGRGHQPALHRGHGERRRR